MSRTKESRNKALVLEPLYPLQLRDAHPAVLRLPVEAGRTADPMLPDQLAECDSGFAFFKIATICDSVNLDFLMTSPVPGESTIYVYPSRGSLRFRCGNTTTERPIFQT